MQSQVYLINVFRHVTVVWWLFWLLIAVVTVGGLSWEVIMLVLMSLLGFYLGTFRFGILTTNVDFRSDNSDSVNVIVIYLLACIILFQFYLLKQSFVSISTLGDVFRSAYYEGETLGGSYVFVLYEAFIIPVGIYLISYWACKGGRGGALVFFILVFFSIDAAIKIGRFPLYFAMFFLAYIHLTGVYVFKIKYIIAFIVGVLSISFYLLILRASFVGEFNVDLIQLMFEKAFINYHIVGFYILDAFTQMKGMEHYSAFPYYTLGFFQYMASLFLRRVGVDIEYPQQHLNVVLSNPVDIGVMGYSNAFGTNLLPLYLDGGFILCFIVFFIMGWLLRTRICSIGKGFSPINLIVAFTMFFGIFQPVIMSGIFLLPLTIHCLVSLAVYSIDIKRAV